MKAGGTRSWSRLLLKKPKFQKEVGPSSIFFHHAFSCHTLEELLETLKSELNKLGETVKTQNLTPEEVIRMNTDRETLTRNLEDLKQKIAETHKIVMSLEVKVSNRAAAVEEALDTYTNMLSTLELFPNPPEPWQDIDLTLELNSASANPQQLLIGPDIKKVIKLTLSSVAEAKRRERAAVENESVKVHNAVDQFTTECKNLSYELEEQEKQQISINEQADELRDVCKSLSSACYVLDSWIIVLGYSSGSNNGQ